MTYKLIGLISNFSPTFNLTSQVNPPLRTFHCLTINFHYFKSVRASVFFELVFRSIFCLISLINRFCMMWLKNFVWLVLLLGAFQTIQGNPIKRVTPTVFKLNNTVRTNETDLSELACTGYDQLASRLCSNITEVTCQQLGRIKSCMVSNQDSIFFNTPVVNQTIVCNGTEQTKGSCLLIFSPDLTKSVGQLSSKKIDWFEDERRKMDERHAKDMNKFWAKTAIAVFGVFVPMLLIILYAKYQDAYHQGCLFIPKLILSCFRCNKKNNNTNDGDKSGVNVEVVYSTGFAGTSFR